jgi:hypothetical protein
MNLEKTTLLKEAYILGATSPNSTNKKVTATTVIKNSILFSIHSTEIAPPKSWPIHWLIPATISALSKSFKINVDKITIPIFIKLLTIRIVANNLAGFSNNLSIRFEGLLLSFFKSSIEEEDREKKAISLPEINAEHSNNSMRMISEIIIPVIPMFR